jgi:two-component system cell cycle response regulator
MAEEEKRGEQPGPKAEARLEPGATTPEPGELARLRADCAQLLDANQRLQAAARRRDDLLALAAADLEGPAAALLSQVRRLSRDAAVAPARRRTFASMERSAARVAAVAHGLASLRAVEGGRVLLHRRPADLAALIARAAAASESSARRRGVAVVHDAPDAVAAPVDAEAVGAVLAMLLDAAVAATARGGRVRIALERAPAGAVVTVEDGRAGARASQRAPLRPTVLGVELAFGRAVAELHGGELELEARASGQVARLMLPLEVPAEATPAAAAPPGRPRLVVADDDPDARELLAMMLGEDYAVQVAADGQEALDLALAGRPDIVLMDVYMPRLDGLEALQALRAEPVTADLPVILVSGRGDELTRARSLDLGAVDFLQKPFSPRELKARIERTLRLTRRESHLAELARTDPLTGLANLRAFRARLDEEVKRARRYATPLACVMVDMDNLKPINDELGHAAGDLAIGRVAEVIRRQLRETDFGARYGGDEFVVLLPHTTASEARVFAERVSARLGEAALDVDGRHVPLAASFGLAALTDDALDDDAGDALVRRADAALYEAKRAGRGQVATDASLGDDVATGAP